MAKFQHHLFICENQRFPGHPRGCCASKDAKEVRAHFKELIRLRGLKGVIRANGAGCLDQCDHGVSVVVYPQATWYGGVQMDDAEEILDSLESGQVVERLVVADGDLTGRDPAQQDDENPA